MSEHLNPEEREIRERFERGELRRAVGIEHEMEGARQAARATFMSRRIPGLVGAVLSIAALGCGEADQETASAYATVDSAGVEILRLSDLHALDLSSIETDVFARAPAGRGKGRENTLSSSGSASARMEPSSSTIGASGASPFSTPGES